MSERVQGVGGGREEEIKKDKQTKKELEIKLLSPSFSLRSKKVGGLQ